MDGKNDELDKLKSSMETVGNDPHDSWDIDAFKATLKEEGTSGEDSEKKESGSNLKRAFVDVKEGGIVSYPAGKAVYGAARNALIAKQEADFEKLKAKAPSSEEISISDTDESPVGSKIDGLPEESKSAEWKDWENRDDSKELVKAEVITPEPEEVASKVSPEFEKAKAEWREKRDKANKLEADYQQKYEAYIKEQSKGWGMVSTLPRRALGIQPKISRELLWLKAKADSSRISFNAAAKELLTMSGNDVAERLNRRLLPKVAATLPLVHQRRLEAQKQGLGQAWSESKYVRPTLETISKNKGTLTAVSLGIAAMTPVGVVPVLAAIGAGLVAGKGTLEIGNSLFVVPSRKKLAEARATVGDNFFEKSYREMDKAMEGMTFHVEAQEARIKTAAVSAGVLAGIAAGGYARGLGAMEQVTIGTPDTNLGTDTPSPTIPSSIIERAPFGTAPVEAGADLPVADAPVGDSSISSPEAEVASEPDSVEESSGRAGSDSTGTRVDRVPEPTIGRADGAASELPRSSGSGVERVDTNTEPLIKDKTVPEVEVAEKDYSLPQSTSVGKLPSIGIVETVPQDPNLTPMTESEATATFGSNTGPSIEGLTAPEQIVHTVEKGENVWNIMEGKGPDANPVGGKSEVLQGMSPADRGAALDKLVEYYEKHPDEAIEVGAVKSEGNIHRVYPGEEINVSMLDDKLRELLGINETASEVAIPAEVGTVEETPATAEPEVTEALDSEATPESVDINNMSAGDILAMWDGVQSGDPQTLAELNEMGFDRDSYEALNEAISNNVRPGTGQDMTLPLTEWMNQYGQPATPEVTAVPPQPDSSPILDRVSYTPDDATLSTPEAAPITPEPIAANANEIAVNNYVAGVEKATGGFLDSIFGLSQPNVGGTFDLIKGVNLNDMIKAAQSGQILEGVNQAGWDRWADTLQKQVQLIPANSTETVGDYVTRIASTRIA